MILKNCKYCGKKITEETRYSNSSCNKPECKRKKLKICEDNCFDCIYEDCIIDSSLLGSYQDNKVFESLK